MENFSKSNECIAIKSTIYNLVESLDHSNELCDTSIEIREVEYGYEKVRERNNSNSVRGFDIVFTKRREFAHEKELRLTIWKDTWPNAITPDQKGIKLKVKLETMISEIIIGPEAPQWMEDLIKRITKKYGFSFETRQSTLLKLTL